MDKLDKNFMRGGGCEGMGGGGVNLFKISTAKVCFALFFSGKTTNKDLMNMAENYVVEPKRRKTADDDEKCFTRSKATEFDWKLNCFICGQICHPKKRKTWSLVAGAINERSTTYSSVVEAAEKRNDRDMLARMLSSNGDLVAVEARYHRDKGCLRTYINDRNVKSINSTPDKSSYVKACKILKYELYHSVAHEKRVCELAELKERFIDIASENKISVNSSMQTSYFKKVLGGVWPELRFIERKGKTDLVCIDNLSVEEAVLRLVNIETELDKSYEYENKSEPYIEGISYSDEASIVHKAAVIFKD